MTKPNKSIFSAGIYAILALPLGFLAYIFAAAFHALRGKNRRNAAEKRALKMKDFRNISN